MESYKNRVSNWSKSFLSVMLILITSIVFTACSEPNSKNSKFPSQIKDDSFNYEFLEIPNTKNLSSIACIDDFVFVADFELNKIMCLDLTGNVIKEVGKLGMGKNEFNSPIGLAIMGKYLYVLDSGSSRIIKMDFNLNEVDHCYLPPLDSYDNYFDLAIDDSERVYLSVNAGGLYTGIFGESDLHKISENSFALFNDKDKVLACQFYTLSKERDKDIYESKEQPVVELVDGKISEIKFTYPNGYTPIDIDFDGSFVYSIAGYNQSVQVYDTSGEYVKTIHDFSIELQQSQILLVPYGAKLACCDNEIFFVTGSNGVHKINGKN